MRNSLILFFILFNSFFCLGQIKYGDDLSKYHHFLRKGGGASVYINQIDSSQPILRLSSSTDKPNVNVRFTVENNGNVGIGTTKPLGKLTIKNSSSNSGGYGSIRLLGDGDANLRIGVDKDYSWIQSHGSKPLRINDWGNNVIINRSGGNVGIGTTKPDAKLAVNGDIHTKEVKVDLNGWADFVFKKDYNLPSLSQVEKHIQEKGHLADIPSAKEVAENGVKLGEMNKKLLQKIEELTLYTIAQEKRLKSQDERYKKQEERIKNQDVRLEMLEKLVKNQSKIINQLKK